MLLRAILLIFISAPWVLSVTVKRNMTEYEQKIHINLLNGIRQKNAIDEQVANMHELVYDPALESLSYPECEISNDDITVRNNDGVSTYYNAFPPTDRYWVYYAQHIDPLQTSAACHHLTCKSGSSNNNSVSGCIFGPVRKFSSSEVVKGEPGSKCPKGRSSLDLCTNSGGMLYWAPALILAVMVHFNFI
ncbi:SCP domain-containing protein [Caenorhabditis elegans]|uniref:SCP domain-containing protein n=1 Tax=Caenorhabditis elegans TaxID=6239 RepID=Q9NAM3_CAEEL|nr:SCP domain-containing protein [Caenorhabditis elegans]CAB54363.4 SCP domain-containing protein [Caenorhabditis elegans]|eukprot:NP_502907.4 Uncharacterized protein CELE_Y105C5B.18 [Caenorhabditis elegans]